MTTAAAIAAAVYILALAWAATDRLSRL